MNRGSPRFQEAVLIRRAFLLGACALLIGAGLTGADSISSTIVCDGAAFVSSSVLGQGKTCASDLFTTNPAILIRDLILGDDGTVRSVTSARSDGPMGVDEFSGQVTDAGRDEKDCVFTTYGNETPYTDRITYMGLLQTGQYISSRMLGPSGTRAVTMVNGSGMMLARASSSDGTNETTHSADVTGGMNMTEEIVFGGGT